MSYKERSNIRLTYTPPKKRGYQKDTLDSLEEDEEYIAVSERFLSSIGENDQQVEDVYEYLRDEEWNLGSSAKRSLVDIPSFTDQQKKDYKYLRQRFDNADMGGFSQYLNFAKDATIDLATDPLTLTALIAAPFTGGASTSVLFANKGLAQAAKLGLKKVGNTFKDDVPLWDVIQKEGLKQLDIDNKVDWKSTINKAKLARQEAVRQYYKDKVKNTALFGAAEGAVWTGMDDYLRQERESIDGIDIRDGLNLYDIASSTFIGGALGAGLGAGLSKASTAFSQEARQNLTKFSDETFVDENSLGFKASKLKDTVISKTVGKPVTRFLTLAESSPALKNLLATVRYDTFKFKGPGAAKLNYSYNEVLNNYQGKYLQQYEDLIRPLLIRGKMNKEDEFIMDKLMRVKNDQWETKVPEATATHHKIATEMKELAGSVLKDGKNVGIFRQPLNAGPNDWLTRRWKWSEVQENRKELADIMVNSNAVSISDVKVISLLPDGPQKEEYIRKTNLSDTFEDMVDNLKNQRVEDINNFVEKLQREYNTDISIEAPFLVENTDEINAKLGELFVINEKAKREIANTLPDILKGKDAADLRTAKYEVANNIIDDMLSKRNQVNTLDIETLGTVAPSSFSPRKLFLLDDLDIEKFIDHDFDSLMRDYFTQSSRLYARSRTLGKNINEFNERYVRDIESQLKAKDITLTNNDKEELARLYNFTTGLDNQNFGMNGLSIVPDTIKITQQLAHLPLATLSSLTEIFIPLTRLNTATWAKGVAQTIKYSVQKQSEGTVRELQDRFNLSKEDALAEMHRVFLGINQAVAQRIDGLAGEGIQSTKGKKIQSGFFRLNLLEQWTRTVQLASFTMGKDLITQNLRKMNKLKDIEISKSGNPDALPRNKEFSRLTQELLDLGVDIKTGLLWEKAGANKYTDNVINGLRQWNDFYETNVMGGAARFTNEVILDPSKAASIRPHVQQTPMGTVLLQFMGYPTAFSNTVLKNFYGQAARDPIRGGGKVLGTGLLMTMAAAGTNWVRNGGSFKDSSGEEQDAGEIAFEAVSRWGGFGYGEYVKNARENAEIGGGTLGSVTKAVTGPIVGDAIDAILYRKGPGELLATNTPGYSLYRALPSLVENNSFKQDVKEVGKSIDRAIGLKPALKEQSYDAYLQQGRRKYLEEVKLYAEGGEVFSNVPRASVNPSSRIDRMTGMPYEDQAGDIIDNRAKFSKGKLVKAIQRTLNLTDDEIDRVTFDPTQENKAELDNFISYEDTPIQDRKQAELLKSLNIEESAVKDDVYIVQNKTGWMVAQTQPPVNIPKSRKGSIRTLNPFVYDGELDQEFNPSDLLEDENFMSKLKDPQLLKQLDRLRKERKRILATNIEDLSYADPLDSISWNAFRTLDKSVTEFLKKAGYDSIQFNPKQQQPKDLAKEAVNVTEQTVQQEVPPVRTAFESTGATATALLEEADKAIPGSRELLAGGVREIEATDILPPERPDLIDSTVTTYSFEGRNEPLLASEMQPNKSWFLLDDTMFMEDSVSPVVSTQTYFDFNTQLHENYRTKFIEQNKIGPNTSTESLKQKISAGPFNIVTSLIPRDKELGALKEELPNVPVVFGPLPKQKDAFAYHSKSDNTIYIDPVRMEEKYQQKAWTTLRPDVLEKKPGAEPLPENAIQTREEWEEFVKRHEYAHSKYDQFEGELDGEYENRMNRIALGIPQVFPSKTLTVKQATERSLALLKSELNLKDADQNKTYNAFKKQFDASLIVPERQIPIPLYFITEVIPGQSSKYLNNESGRLLNASEMAAFLKGRQKTKPAEALHHPVNNNIRHPNAKAFASIAPTITNQKESQQAANEYLKKVIITEEQPYTLSAFEKFETRSQMDSARTRETDETEGILGLQGRDKRPDLEEYDPKQDQIKRGKGGVRYMRTPDGDILVEYDKDTKRFEPILSNPLDNQSFIYYSPDKDMSAFKPKKRRKARVAAKAPSLRQPKQRSILTPPEKFPRKTQITEDVRNTVAYKGASEEARKRIDDQLNELARRQEQGTL